jgi:hypothetical protein
VPPPVSSELHAQRESARAAIAAAVGPVDVRRIVWAPIASTGPRCAAPLSLYPCSAVARIATHDIPVSLAVTRARLCGGRRGQAGWIASRGAYRGLLAEPLRRACPRRRRGRAVRGRRAQLRADHHHLIHLALVVDGVSAVGARRARRPVASASVPAAAARAGAASAGAAAARATGAAGAGATRAAAAAAAGAAAARTTRASGAAAGGVVASGSAGARAAASARPSGRTGGARDGHAESEECGGPEENEGTDELHAPRMTGPSPLKRPFCRARQLVSRVYERCDIWTCTWVRAGPVRR